MADSRDDFRNPGPPPDDVRRRVLGAVRQGLGLGAIAVLSREADAGCRLVACDVADGRIARPEGTLLDTLGAAAGAWRTRQTVVLNQDAPRPMAVPYAERSVTVGGAVALVLEGGLVWADRVDGPLGTAQIDAVREVGRLLDLRDASERSIRQHAARLDELAATVEGVRSILAGGSEREAVAALAEAAARQAEAARVLVVLLGDEPGRAMVVGGAGARAREAVGRTFSIADGMLGLALRTGVVMPPGGHYQAAMGPILSPGVPVHVRIGEPLALLLLGAPEDPLGAVVRVGGRPDASIHGLRTLADTAALLIRQFRLRERLARDAMFDGLTGLYNRRALSLRLSESFAAARRHDQPLALVMLDLDHFKAVNDLHGHLVGDRVLREFADVIRLCLRESDYAGRYGGEEFALVLPGADANGARGVAERIRQRVEASRLVVASAALTVTVSGGVAALGAGMVGPQDLVAAADGALYVAKRAGRNRIFVASVGCAEA